MRIEGANEFLSSFVTRHGQSAAQNILKPFVIRKEDSIDFSEMGKQLSLQSRTAVEAVSEAQTGGDRMLGLMNKSMSEMESILNQMKDLTKLAANPNLNMADRLQLQIDMEKLEGDLERASGSMSKKLAEMSGIDPKALQEPMDLLFDGRIYDANGANHDTRSMLERARDRALNGEEWDVAEKYETFVELRKIIIAGENPREINVAEGEWIDQPDVDPAKNIMTLVPDIVGGRYYATDDKDVPTVSEVLEERGTILLTDVKSAVKGLERIENELTALSELRREFAEFTNQGAAGPGASLDAGAATNAEVAEMLGNMAKTQQAKTEELQARLDPPKALEEAAREQANPASAEGGSRPQLRTELGIMEETDKGWRLVRPNSPKGGMFAKIERLFDEIADNLLTNGSGKSAKSAADFSTAGMFSGGKTTWTNRSQSWIFGDKGYNTPLALDGDGLRQVIPSTLYKRQV